MIIENHDMTPDYEATRETCPFCDPEPERIIHSNEYCIALFDGFPVSSGHTLVLPRRHVASIFSLTEQEWQELWALVRRVRLELAESHTPDGFNLGVNDGLPAGQTVLHAHVHIIPRRKGDVDDPRGGVRAVIPAKARYW